jgi:hypothetical protein
VIDQRIGHQEVYEYLACLLLAGESGKHAKESQRLLTLHLNPRNDPGLFGINRGIAIAPTLAIPAAELVKWCEVLMAMDRSAWSLHVLALAHYRKGDYPLALGRLRESELLPWGNPGKCQNLLLRAMLLNKQNNLPEAKSVYKQATTLTEREWTKSRKKTDAANPDYMSYLILKSQAIAEGLNNP